MGSLTWDALAEVAAIGAAHLVKDCIERGHGGAEAGK